MIYPCSLLRRDGPILIAFLFVLISAFEVYGHGDPTGKEKTTWDFTGCCSQPSRTGYRKTVSKEYNYVNPNPGTRGVREQAPGLHWHNTVSNICVDRHHWGYHDSCDTPVTVCRPEWRII